MSTRVPVIFGAGSFGNPNTNTPRIHTLAESQEVVDIVLSHGIRAFDTSRFYGLGSSEEFLGKLDLKGSTVDTKIYPIEPGYFAPTNLRAVFQQSLKALGDHKVRVFYLHFPDRSAQQASFEDILREVNEFHKEGLIEEFGLSNFFSWEVAEFVCIARHNGWIQPTVYQGRYNAIERIVETELMPCLKKYGIRFFAYSPLAGGMLVGKNLTPDKFEYSSGSRFDPKASSLAKVFTAHYEPLWPVLRELKLTLDNIGISMPQAAYRWLQHHSALGPRDAMMLGASSVSQVEPNLKDCEAGPLPEHVLKVLDEAWEKAKGSSGHYAAATQRTLAPLA
ncbi:Aldo/keto reductase [Athelia psychrophila]|uniref:Aldo/keto reductase n=1 Tax=Athelia psychrophila TaxID=1759441 RepID=A0A166DD46_9AGAM|nr:Aldo/keto reductase [Fibularhizoctonia sp. CBS 109695]